KIFEPLHRFLYGHPVGKQSAQPAVVHVEHAAASSFFSDCILGLPFGADKKDSPALSGAVLHKLARVFKHLERLLQVDDVNAVPFPKDVLLHLGVPALGLVAKVDTRLKQLLHGDISQTTSLLDCILCGWPARSGFIPCPLPLKREGRFLVPVDQPLISAFGTPWRTSKI